MRIVMWSGPRNLSTALMRSFGARDPNAAPPDTGVLDKTVDEFTQTFDQRRVLSMEGGNLVIEQTNPGRSGGATIKVAYKKD